MNMTSKPLSRPQLPLNEKIDLVQKWLDSCCSPWNFSSAHAHKITSFQRGLLSWLGWHIIDLYNEGTFLALIFKTDWPPKCSLLLMWIAWSPNLLVMSTYITVKAAANPMPSRLPKGSPGWQVTKLLAHSGNSNCVSCFHQPSTEGPAVILHNSFDIVKKCLFWPKEIAGHWHTCPGEPLVQRNSSAKGQSGWDCYFTFSKAIKGKADPHDLQGGNGTPFKISTLVSKSLVHEPLFHLEKGHPAEDEDWCSSVLPTAWSIFRWNSLLYKKPHVESLVQTCGRWKKDRGSSLSLLPNSLEEHAHRRKSSSFKGTSSSCLNHSRVYKESQWACSYSQCEWILQLFTAHKGSLIAFPPKGEKLVATNYSLFSHRFNSLKWQWFCDRMHE